MAGNTLTDTGDGWMLPAAELFGLKQRIAVAPDLGAQVLNAATTEAPSTQPHSLFDIAI